MICFPEWSLLSIYIKSQMCLFIGMTRDPATRDGARPVGIQQNIFIPAVITFFPDIMIPVLVGIPAFLVLRYGPSVITAGMMERPVSGEFGQVLPVQHFPQQSGEANGLALGRRSGLGKSIPHTPYHKNKNSANDCFLTCFH